MNGEAKTKDVQSSVDAPTESDAVSHSRACPACGAIAQRDTARFCATCGRQLNNEDYRPADAVRASYHLHRRSPKNRPTSNARISVRNELRAPRTTRHNSSFSDFITTRNSAAATALAFVTFALVPYLGILFCPGAIAMGVAGLWSFHRAPERGGRGASVFSIAAGMVVCGGHVFLWWILHFIYSLAH